MEGSNGGESNTEGAGMGAVGRIPGAAVAVESGRTVEVLRGEQGKEVGEDEEDDEVVVVEEEGW